MRTDRLGPSSRRPTTVRPGNNRMPAAYRRLEVPVAAEAVPGQREPALARLEAALWLADEPLSPRKLATVAELDGPSDVKRRVAELQQLYDNDGSAFTVEELAGGFQLLTRPAFYPWLARLRQATGDAKLSGALLETLAVIAYKQPVGRADIEAVRGVHCGDALRQLMERKLVHITGRDDSLGRPVLYGTTRQFLQLFGLRSLAELPPVEKAKGEAG